MTLYKICQCLAEAVTLHIPSPGAIRGSELKAEPDALGKPIVGRGVRRVLASERPQVAVQTDIQGTLGQAPGPGVRGAPGIAVRGLG